jgi:hypothetical protein
MLPIRGAMRLFIVLVIVVFTSAPQIAVAQTGADMAASITGPLRVRIGNDITYTITGTNIGDMTATDVQLFGWYPDWFDNPRVDCLAGVADWGYCNYGSLAPGESASMTITLKATAGNKAERRMYEGGSATASNDVNTDNDWAEMPVHMIGPCRDCPNK